MNHGPLRAACRLVKTRTVCSHQASRTLTTGSASPPNPESPLPPPPTPGSARVYPEKIQDIVNRISQLSLIEVADLNECLKVRKWPMAVRDPGILFTDLSMQQFEFRQDGVPKATTDLRISGIGSLSPGSQMLD